MSDLSPATRKFVLHWGEMGTRWGVNRSVAQIHALLYVSDRPRPAEEIASSLALARSNVSTSLKELQSWRLVRIVHVLGDRRDHFESHHDVWEMFQIVMEERRRREIDPTMEILRECLGELERDRAAGAHVRKRLEAMLGFLETVTRWQEQVFRLPRGALVKLLRMGGRLGKALGVSA